jgi:hypothetical protein
MPGPCSDLNLLTTLVTDYIEIEEARLRLCHLFLIESVTKVVNIFKPLHHPGITVPVLLEAILTRHSVPLYCFYAFCE